VSWLAAEGVIMAESADCVLGAESGYPPGPRYAAAVTGPDDRLPGLRANGVEVRTGRNLFHPVQGEFGPVVCPGGGQATVLQDPATGELTGYWERFDDALGACHAGDPAEVACPACGQAAGFNDWRWAGEWPFAIGFLGFTFWELAATERILHRRDGQPPRPQGRCHPRQALTRRPLW